MNVFQCAKQISPADVARKFGLKESHGRFLCPFHDDHHASMAVYEDSRRFYCFSCHARGDAADLWAKMRGRPLRAAAEELCREYGLECREESREERERRQRVDDVAMLPEAVWKDWQRGMLALLEEEINACTHVMERYPDPEGWLWQFSLSRAMRLQDELSRLKAVEPRLLPAELAERRAAGEACAIADQPVVDDALLQAMLADRLRHAGMRLDARENAWVCRTLGISTQAE